MTGSHASFYFNVEDGFASSLTAWVRNQGTFVYPDTFFRNVRVIVPWMEWFVQNRWYSERFQHARQGYSQDG